MNGYVFNEIEVPQLLRDHLEPRGTRGLARYSATIWGGELRVQVSRDPAGKHGEHLTHVSVSVGRFGEAASSRRPTDAEMQAVREGLFSLVQFEEEETDHPHVRHLWEIKR